MRRLLQHTAPPTLPSLWSDPRKAASRSTFIGDCGHSNSKVTNTENGYLITASLLWLTSLRNWFARGTRKSLELRAREALGCYKQKSLDPAGGNSGDQNAEIYVRGENLAHEIWKRTRLTGTSPRTLVLASGKHQCCIERDGTDLS